MIGEIALVIEMGADAVDIGKTIHPHPRPGESIGGGASGAWQLYGLAADAQAGIEVCEKYATNSFAVRVRCARLT